MLQSRTQPLGGLVDIIGGLARDVGDLVRGEIALARAELDQKLHRFLLAAIWVVGGALMAFAGLVLLLQAIAALLALFMPAWVAALLVGVLIVAVGAVIARYGIGQMTLQRLVPDRTAATLRKDVEMIKEHT